MLEFRWLAHPPDGSLDGAIEIAKMLQWNLPVAQRGSIGHVWAGEDVLLRTDSREVTEAFIYGLGLAYAVLPPDIFDRLKDDVREMSE